MIDADEYCRSEPLNTFQHAARTCDFTVTAQLQLTRETRRESVLQQARTLAPVVDAVQVTDNPNGAVHLSPLVASALLIEEGIDPVLQMTCRDRNKIALQSDLLGARALGITSLLIQRGDKLAPDHRPKTTEVFEIGGKALITAARRISAASGPQEFHIGAVIVAFNPRAGWQAKSLVEKADAGAQFLQMQLCFDMELLRRYMACLVALRLTHRVHVVASLATLPTAEMARWIGNSVRGSVMPEAVIRRLEQAPDPEQEGVKLCAELLEEARQIPGIGGIHLVTPGDVATMPAAIRAAGLRD